VLTVDRLLRDAVFLGHLGAALRDEAVRDRVGEDV
jgi:hypothetical protein